MADSSDNKKDKESLSLEDELTKVFEEENNSNDDNNNNNGKKTAGKIKKFFLYTLITAFTLGIISAGSLAAYMYYLGKDLPSSDEFSQFKYTEPMVVYDAKGTIIAELGEERRYPVAIENMPKHVYLSVVAVEDGRFYEHSGIDPLGILRAMITNIKAGKMVEGGSTLTQQLVKVIYLSPERKLKRKLKEVIIAYRLDRDLPKDKILELYLNQVNFGRGAYGIQAAAINYFGKQVNELTIAEAAMIAGIPKGPSRYAPHINMQRAIKRRNHVLNRMRELNFITEDEYIKAKEEKVNLAETIPLKLRYAGYFMDFVHKYIEEDLGIENAQSKGLKVYTTLNLDYQIAAEKALIKNLMEIAKREGYVGPIGEIKHEETIEEDDDETVNNTETSENMPDNMTEVEGNIVEFNNIVPSYLRELGYKKALVTNVTDKKVDIIFADNQYGVLDIADNRWANPVSKYNDRNLRDFRKILKKDDLIYVSPNPKKENSYFLEQDPNLQGSIVSINPKTGEIYAMVGGISYNKSFFNRAVQAKRQVGSTFKPLVYSVAYESGFYPMSTFHDTPIAASSTDSWRPKNFDGTFSGEMNLQDALKKSNNLITIKVAQQVGIEKIVDYAYRYGMTGNIPFDLSVSLGSISASPLEMAYAYATFANQGYRPEKPYFITRIADIDNKTLYEFAPPEQVQVLSPAAASMITDSLIKVVESGGAIKVKNNIPRLVGGKTGTTNGPKDGWFAGVFPSLVTISWVGYDDFKDMGAYAVGGTTALNAWLDYTKEILDTIPQEIFPMPVNTAYFKVNKETNEITDSVTGDFTFAIFPLDAEGNAKLLEAE